MIESQAASQPPRRKKAGLIVTAVVLTVSLLCGCVIFGLYQLLTSGMETTNSLVPLSEAAYPDYEIVDYTIQGHILQHQELEALRIDVRYVEQGENAYWDWQPLEDVDDIWQVNDTFFRHADGMDPDPRTGMTYDVQGFSEAYETVRPGPNSVVMGVWLDEDDGSDLESYAVLVARRNRGEGMWPDHLAIFLRDPETGEWTPVEFEQVDVPDLRSE